jgi:hypothetical protein
MEVLRPKDTRLKGFLISAGIVAAFAFLSAIVLRIHPILSVLLLVIGLIPAFTLYFNNLVTVPIGKHAVRYFWDEPQKSAVLSEGTHWILPFFEKVTWDDITIQSQVFTLNNIRASNNEPLSFNVIVQYSVFDVRVTLYKKLQDRVIKMQQILTDTLNVEIQQNNITDTGIIASVGMLTTRVKNNLATHMELQWGCKVDGVSIMGITHLNQIRYNDLSDKNSLQLQINRVLQIAQEFGCTPEEAFKKDLIRTGRVTQNQNVNIYSFPEAASIIQSVAPLLNRR